jgi:hypothetical protein
MLLFGSLIVLLAPGATWGGDTAADAKRAAEVRKKVETTIDFSGISDPDTRFGEALDFLARVAGLTFEINEQAFKDEMIDDVAAKPLGREIPKMTGVPAEKVLRKLLARIPSSSGTTFVVRGGVVEITTGKAASPFTWEEAPQVSFAFDKRPLPDALREIADATGVNIVLDARAGDKGQTPITATVRAVGVDTAVQLLANMADLTTMPVENVLYVTTRENAKTFRAELLKLEPAKADAAKAVRAESARK